MKESMDHSPPIFSETVTHASAELETQSVSDIASTFGRSQTSSSRHRQRVIINKISLRELITKCPTDREISSLAAVDAAGP